MKKSSLSIHQLYYFPLSFRLVGFLLPAFFLFFLFKNQYVLAGLTLIMSVLAITTRYKIDFDFANKTYHEYLWILGFKKGEKMEYQSISNGIINEKNVTKTYNSRGSTSRINFTEYLFFLQIDDEKVEVVSSDKESRVDEAVIQIKQAIPELQIIDNR